MTSCFRRFRSLLLRPLWSFVIRVTSVKRYQFPLCVGQVTNSMFWYPDSPSAASTCTWAKVAMPWFIPILTRGPVLWCWNTWTGWGSRDRSFKSKLHQVLRKRRLPRRSSRKQRLSKELQSHRRYHRAMKNRAVTGTTSPSILRDMTHWWWRLSTSLVPSTTRSSRQIVEFEERAPIVFVGLVVTVIGQMFLAELFLLYSGLASVPYESSKIVWCIIIVLYG